MALAPAEHLGGDREVLPPHRVRRLGRQVLHPELERIHLQRVREFVHQHLGVETPLRMARRAHRPCGTRVREDVLVAAATIRDAVDVRQRETRTDAGATGAPRLGIERGDDAVGIDPGLDARERRGPIADRQMLFLAIEHHLHRRAGLLGQLRARHALDVGPELAAEPAAHELGNHADVRLRNAERLGESFARAVNGLRRRPGRQVFALPLAHAAVRFERDVRLHLRLVAGLDRLHRLREPGVEIAGLLRLAFLDVAVLEDRRRTLAHRERDGRDMGQHFVLDLDQPQRILCLLLGRGGDGRNLIALEHQLFAGLGDRQHRLYSRRLFRGAEIERDDPRMRVRRSEDAAMEHAGPVDVERVLRAPGGLDAAVQPRHARANENRLVRPRVFLVLGRLRRGSDFGDLRRFSHGPPPSSRARLRGRGCRCRIDRYCR